MGECWSVVSVNLDITFARLTSRLLCGTCKCSRGPLVAANRGRKCGEGKKKKVRVMGKKSKSDGDCLWFQHTAQGSAGEEPPACAATT